MTVQRSRAITIVGMINVLMGTVYGISATFSLIFITLPSVDHADRELMYASVATVAAALGVSSGLGLVRLKPWGRWLSLIFAVILLLLAVMMITGGRFAPERHFLVVAYPVLLLFLLTRRSCQTAFAEAP